MLARKTRDVVAGASLDSGISLGLEKIAGAVGSTMGPNGSPVLIENEAIGPYATKDGFYVARECRFEDPVENVAAAVATQAAIRQSQGPGDGPQPLDSKVLTPGGFIRMGDVKVGMTICGTNGTTQKVLGVFEKGKLEVYRVKFGDGSVVECSKDHLWQVIDTSTVSKKKRVFTVESMMNGGKIRIPKKDKKGSFLTHSYYVPKTHVEFGKKKLPLDPYLVGVLLGDGSISGSGTLEISLGFKKRHILEKLVLPDGADFVSRDCEKYIRVKLHGASLKEALKEVELYGTRSSTKFIPKAYLYSSLEDRKKLLQGLLDTDGHINGRSLFEFSTVSPRLAEDIVELANSLGLETRTRIHNRDKDEDSYSDRPVFRIAQCKGRKYGTSIDSIEPTGEEVEMRCIKVSNDDCLYITDDYIPTHNTTSTIILVQAFYEACKAGNLKPGRMREMAYAAAAGLRKRGVKADRGLLKAVARMAGNGPEVGDAVDAVLGDNPGRHVVLEESGLPSVETGVSDGFVVSRPMAAPFMANRADGGCDMGECAVAVVNGTVGTAEHVARILGAAYSRGFTSVLVVAGRFENEALVAVYKLMNERAENVPAMRVLCVAHGWRGQECGASADDLAAYVGGKASGGVDGKPADLSGFTADRLGTAKSVKSDRRITIVESKGYEGRVAERLASIEEERAKADAQAERDMLDRRKSNLSGGYTMIRVGARTESDAKELKDRYEDAVMAVKCAAESGVLPGAGNAMAYAAFHPEEFGVTGGDAELSALRLALLAPITLLYGTEDGADELSELEWGRQASLQGSHDLVDLMADGIVDPVEVTCSAIEHAASAAWVLAGSGNALVFSEKFRNAPPGAN
jgi:hypothetical protein